MENPYYIVFFDGVCNLCNAAVKRIIKYDRHDCIRMASLQSDYAHERLLALGMDPTALTSIVLITPDNKVYTKSTAVLHIARKLAYPMRLCYAGIIFPLKFRDWIYDLVAKKRYSWFGIRESCMVPTPDIRQKFLDQ